MNLSTERLDAANPPPGIVARIRDAVSPSRIILFGSRATGAAQPDSDYDILVVLPGRVNRRQETVRVMRLFERERIPIDVLVIGEDQVEEVRARLLSVVRVALEHGRVVCAA